MRMTKDVRESMRYLPSWMQPFLTWLTGKPLKGQIPGKRTRGYHLVTCGVSLVAGWSAIAGGLAAGPAWAIAFVPAGLLLVTSAMRKLQVVIIHHLSHSNFFARKNPLNRYLGRALSFLLFVEPFDSYRDHHIRDHHFQKHMTIEDPTVQFLTEKLGLRAGMPVSEAKSRIRRSLLNPAFYFNDFISRIREQFSAGWAYRVCVFTFHLALLVGALKSGLTDQYLLGWAIPLFILYPVSSAFRLLVEHRFPRSQAGRKFDLASLSDLTNAVFCGDLYPSPQKISKRAIFEIGNWWVRLVFIHLPVRVFVLVGDTPVHDHHHREPLYADWPNYAFARQGATARPKQGYPEYNEIWGYSNALESTLQSISRAEAGALC